jgi:hypothetical protein
MSARSGITRPLLLLVSATLALGLGIARASTGATGRSTVTIIEHSTTDVVADIGTKGDSAGDVLTFHNRVFDATDSRPVGRNQGECAREDPRAGTWECWWTTSLAGGQITVEGPFSDTHDTTFAVTGGTGLYENARGSMRVRSLHGGREYEQTFALIT